MHPFYGAGHGFQVLHVGSIKHAAQVQSIERPTFWKGFGQWHHPLFPGTYKNISSIYVATAFGGKRTLLEFTSTISNVVHGVFYRSTRLKLD